MGSSAGFVRQGDPLLLEGMAGEWFSSGRGPLDIPTMESVNLLIANPLGSGKLVMIHRYRVHVTSASEYIDIVVNPTTDLPVTVAASTNRRLGSPNGVAIVTMDVNPVPMTGGTPLPYSIPVETASQTFTEFMIFPAITLPPGFSIGTSFTNSSGGASKMVNLLDWREVKV